MPPAVPLITGTSLLSGTTHEPVDWEDMVKILRILSAICLALLMVSIGAFVLSFFAEPAEPQRVQLRDDLYIALTRVHGQSSIAFLNTPTGPPQLASLALRMTRLLQRSLDSVRLQACITGASCSPTVACARHS